MYLELCRRGYQVYIGKAGVYEIDFVAMRQNEKIYVQVTQRIDSEKTEKREYERLFWKFRITTPNMSLEPMSTREETMKESRQCT